MKIPSLLLTTAAAILLCSSALAKSSKSLSTYTAMIGNHATIVVKDFGAGKLEVRGTYDNGRQESYLIDLAAEQVEAKLDQETRLVRGEEIEDYRNVLRSVRDLIAYTTAPVRYDWLVFGTSVLNLELNAVIQKIDAAIGVADVHCRLIGAGRVLAETSGGAYSGLSAEVQAADTVWVKEGYELVLSNLADFATENASLLHGRGSDENSELPELSSNEPDSAAGRSFSLASSALAGSLRSFICRPLFQ